MARGEPAYDFTHTLRLAFSPLDSFPLNQLLLGKVDIRQHDVLNHVTSTQVLASLGRIFSC